MVNPSLWTEDAEGAFEQFKQILANCTMLAYPKAEAEIVLCTDASDTAIGAALHLVIDAQIEPLAFYSRKLSPAEGKYSAYDRELLAIYTSIKHFHTQLEARNFAVYTDHKPLVYVFSKKSENFPPHRLYQLNYICQYTTRIRHVKGIENISADTLSRISAVAVPTMVSYEELGKAQETDTKLFNLLYSKAIGLKLQRVTVPDEGIEIFCDVSGKKPRPFLPKQYRRTAFELVHNLARTGPRATAKMVSCPHGQHWEESLWRRSHKIIFQVKTKPA